MQGDVFIGPKNTLLRFLDGYNNDLAYKVNRKLFQKTENIVVKSLIGIIVAPVAPIVLGLGGCAIVVAANNENSNQFCDGLLISSLVYTISVLSLPLVIIGMARQFLKYFIFLDFLRINSKNINFAV